MYEVRFAHERCAFELARRLSAGCECACAPIVRPNFHRSAADSSAFDLLASLDAAEGEGEDGRLIEASREDQQVDRKQDEQPRVCKMQGAPEKWAQS